MGRSSRRAVRGALFFGVLALSMFGAAPVLAGPPATKELEAPPEASPEASPAEADPEASPEAAMDAAAEIPAWMLERDPVAAARLMAMSEADFQAFMVRAGENFDALGPEDKKLVELVIEQMEREFDDSLSFQTGDIEVQGGLATLHLSEDYRFLGPGDSRRLLVEGWENPPSSAQGVLGMIVPAELRTLQEDSWAVILTWSADGYVDDDDAEDLDYDEVLASLKEGSVAENRERRAAGYPALNLVGWAEPPHYDEGKHALYWALHYQSEGAPDGTLNFAIRLLGRRGVLELNGVAGMRQLQEIKPAMEEVYTMVEFNPGHRYSDFDPDIDKIAAYGIGGLILGKVAMKAGLFAGLLKLLVAGKKFLFLGLVGVAAFFRRFVGRETSTEEGTSEDTET